MVPKQSQVGGRSRFCWQSSEMSPILRQRKAIQQLGAERPRDKATYNVTQTRSNCLHWNLKVAPGPMAEGTLAEGPGEAGQGK